MVFIGDVLFPEIDLLERFVCTLFMRKIIVIVFCISLMIILPRHKVYVMCAESTDKNYNSHNISSCIVFTREVPICNY